MSNPWPIRIVIGSISYDGLSKSSWVEADAARFVLEAEDRAPATTNDVTGEAKKATRRRFREQIILAYYGTYFLALQAFGINQVPGGSPGIYFLRKVNNLSDSPVHRRQSNERQRN
jgi:hypothetical protein